MAKKVASYKKTIIRALKAAGTYREGLDMQVLSLASALRALDMANDDIDSLEQTTVLETTRYGQKIAPHPAFRIQRDAQDSVTRQMKALGLTVEDLSGGVEDDPLIELTVKATESRVASDTIIRPSEP